MREKLNNPITEVAWKLTFICKIFSYHCHNYAECQSQPESYSNYSVEKIAWKPTFVEKYLKCDYCDRTRRNYYAKRSN